MSGDVLRTLAEARPAELRPDAPLDGAAREAELARAMAAGRGPGRERVPALGRRRFRPVWALGLTGAATAAAVAAALVAAPGGPEDGPGRGPAAAGGEEAPVTLNARTVLLAAATKAEGRPDRVRAFWHSRTIARRSVRTGTPADPYMITMVSAEEGWTPSGSGGSRWSRRQDLGAKPLGAAGVAAWRRAGSPGVFKASVPLSPGSRRVKPLEVGAAPGRLEPVRSSRVDGGELYWLGRNMTMRQLRALPGDPARLKAELLRWYDGHDPEAAGVPMKSGDWLLRVAEGLVDGSLPVAPKARAAAFRMLSGLGSVRALGTVRDAQGRPGIAIATTDRTVNGVLEHRLIIDPATGGALANETVVVEPAGLNAAMPAGALLHSTEVVANDWTDEKPA